MRSRELALRSLERWTRRLIGTSVRRIQEGAEAVVGPFLQVPTGSWVVMWRLGV
jgi:hypothetical protein